MALIREIFEYLLDPARDKIVPVCENPKEAFVLPKVTKGNYIQHLLGRCDAPIVYTPGRYDPSVARFAIEIKGIKFVCDRDDQVWRPKDEDDLVGVLSFAHSVWFRELGYVVRDDAGRDDCKVIVLRALSGLLDRNGATERLFSSQYKDFGFCRRDFDITRGALKEFRGFGFVYEHGHWWGMWNEASVHRVVGESACALGLIESFDAEQSLCHVYVDVERVDYDDLMGMLRGREDVRQEICSKFRCARDASKVRLLLSADEIAMMRGTIVHGSGERQIEVLNKFKNAFDEALRKWRNALRRELRDIELRRIAIDLGL